MQWSILATIVQASFFITGTFAAFGLTESGNIYTVDTDAGLVFKGVPDQLISFGDPIKSRISPTVDRTNGDVTSMVFNGIEVSLILFFLLSKI